MCHKKSSGVMSGMAPVPVKLAKITVFLVFFCFAECAAGNCLHYGHACWGAHGKRSGNVPLRENEPSKEVALKWFLTKLLQNPTDLRYQYSREEELPPVKQISNQLFNDINELKGTEDYDNIEDILSSDPGLDDSNGKRSTKRLFKKRSTKLN